MNANPNQPSHTWISKFRYAFRGLGMGISEQNSFLVHIPIAVAVVVAATLFRVTQAEWCILTLCNRHRLLGRDVQLGPGTHGEGCQSRIP